MMTLIMNILLIVLWSELFAIDHIAKINGIETEGEYGLSIPIYVAQDNDRIYILDMATSSVNVYTNKGEFLFDFGSFGEGPGEFSRRVSRIFHLEYSNQLCVIDNGHQRVTIFSREGDYISSFFIPEPMDQALELPDGNLILTSFILKREHKPIHLYSRAGMHIRSFGSITVSFEEIFDHRINPLMFSYDYMTHLTFRRNGNLLYAQRSPYVVIEYDLEGKEVRRYVAETPFEIMSGIRAESDGDVRRYERFSTGEIVGVSTMESKVIVVITSPDHERFIDVFSNDGDHIARIELPGEPPMINSAQIRNDSMVLLTSHPDFDPEVNIYVLRLKRGD
jgi:hypothetical protein